MIVVNQDITELKQNEKMIRQALEKEQELGELKSRFVSMASHEFRTPLASILALTETLRIYRLRLPDEQIEQKLGKIKEQVGHLKDVMDDVLQLAQLQARRTEFNPTQFNLDNLCQTILDEFQSQADVTHQLFYTCNDALREVELDKKLMRQLINNLISNAIKYSSSDKTIGVNLTYSDNAFVLTVHDEGIGIPAADLNHLFEPFHRAVNVGTISGTGLGLVIAKESVELHGGTITVESQVGVGTTFTVRIPTVTRGVKNHANNSGD
ncbi:MAG: HAMP domain-containing sensor histidine kinase [Chloroflexi bacterium]|nr:HAMP domain-containing sensor histidine kinase [Chloroflexota bacterium]